MGRRLGRRAARGSARDQRTSGDLTLDVTALRDFWLTDYMPGRPVAEGARFGSSGRISSLLGGHVTVDTVPIPLDCTDGFVEALYGRPEAYLDPAVRETQSAWHHLDTAEVESGLARLSDDIASGAWDSRFGHLRRQPDYCGPLVLVTALPPT